MTTFNLFSDEEQPRFVVEIENSRGEHTVVKQTNNYRVAVDSCNFWDERVNTYLIDRRALRAQETIQERIDRRCDALLEGINARAFRIDKMVTPYVAPYREMV